MNTLRKFVIQNMTFKEMDEVLDDHAEFEKNGYIGDCALRRRAHEYSDPFCDSHIVMWMERLATECAFIQRERYREIHGPLDGSPS